MPGLTATVAARDQAQRVGRPGTAAAGVAPCDAPRWAIFDLEHQFEFYGQYHSNPANVIIHVICVPVIFATSLVLTHRLPFFQSTIIDSWTFGLPTWLTRTGLYGLEYQFNSATITSILYSVYFIALEPVAGFALAPFLLSCGQWSNVLFDLDPDRSMNWAWTLFILSWVFQFVGHGQFEKRKPALLDNLFQSFVLALFFVWLEVWFFLGYRKDLSAKLRQRIGRAVAEFKATKAQAKTHIN